MKVTARFVCSTVTVSTWGETVKMNAIWSGHPDDNNYAEATPSGDFEMCVTNKALYGHFKPGEVYDFTITKHEASA